MAKVLKLDSTDVPQAKNPETGQDEQETAQNGDKEAQQENAQNSDKQKPKDPIAAPHNKIFRAGYNLGNDSVKLLIEGFDPIRTTSALAFLKDESRSFLIPGSVQYRGFKSDVNIYQWGGENKNLSWLGGDNALDAELKSLDRIYGNPIGKSQFSLYMFLSAVALLSAKHGYRTKWRFKVAISCHKPGLFSEIKKSLQGCHRVLLNNQASEIEIDVVDIIPEGLGAASEINTKTKKVALLDIGGGTSAVSHYQGSRPLLDKPEFYEKSGVLALYKAVLESEVINGHSSGFTIDDVRLAIESGLRDIVIDGEKVMEPDPTKPDTLRAKKGILLGEKTRLDITQIYVASLTEWLKAELKEACRKLAVLQDRGYTVFVIGGGSKLPLLAAQLKKAPYNFNIATNGLYADVEGLLSIVINK